MEIGKAIKQSRFRNERQKAMINILFTHSWLMEQIKNHFRDAGLTPQQFNILRILRGSNPEPLTVLDLKARMLDKNCDASRLVERLLVKGVVKKKVCNSDKRRVDIVISQKGLDLLATLDARETEMDNIASSLTDEDAATLSQLLDKLRSNAD
jgi:MarR family transcriptional regulator, 2-MHQ and catechol-resistance regulon repressor